MIIRSESWIDPKVKYHMLTLYTRSCSMTLSQISSLTLRFTKKQISWILNHARNESPTCEQRQGNFHYWSFAFLRARNRSFAAAKASRLLLWWSGFGSEADGCSSELLASTEEASGFGFVSNGVEAPPCSPIFSVGDSTTELGLSNECCTSSDPLRCSWSCGAWPSPSWLSATLLSASFSRFLAWASFAPYATFLSRFE